LTALSAEFTIGEGELMAHDVPLGCAPDEYDDLISGTCSHLPYFSTYKCLVNEIPHFDCNKKYLVRTMLTCKNENTVLSCVSSISKNNVHIYSCI
ncbi:hypothetical protein, partial [Klebsiella pneumoniae]|uniref:hypothetical protein n=1 Tax=Klebsiella pneumoniae TaxID=573 RepID=UPI001A939F39